MRKRPWATVLLLVLCNIGYGQQLTPHDSKATDVLTRMKSARWIERSDAFEEATALIESGKENARDLDELRLGLIRLLDTETSAAKNPTTTASGEEREGYSNYCGDLIGAVADLKDARAIPSLLENANSGGMATRGVAHFGKIALDSVLQQVKGQDSQLASGALFVIRDMLEFQTVSDSNSLTRIRNVLQSALARPDMIVRQSAIYAIEYLADRESFVPALTEMARRDPFKIAGRVASDGQDDGEVYPVRRMARLLLAKIANHEHPIIDRGVPAP